MKNLNSFIDDLNEARRLPTDVEKNDKGQITSETNPKVDDKAAKLDMDKDDPDLLTRNGRVLQERFDSEQDFFILGHAGWGKTSIIKKLAEKNGYQIKTVYLDKMPPEDLAGMPVPVKGNANRNTLEQLPPPWAKEIIDTKDDPKIKWLLFFDEMNQADPQIMNALMPIVLEKEIAGISNLNYFVGAAGNFKSENEVFDLPGPLASRFRPIIIWEDDTEDSWKAAMDFMRTAKYKKGHGASVGKTFTEIYGKKFMDLLASICKVFNNPREITDKVLNKYVPIIDKGLGNEERYKSKYILQYLMGVDPEGMDSLIRASVDPRDAKSDMQTLADAIHEVLVNSTKSEEETASAGRRGRSADKPMISKEVAEFIDMAFSKGYYYVYDEENPMTEVPILSEENIYDVIDPEDASAEQVKQYIKHQLAKGKKFKYKTTAEGLADRQKTGGSTKYYDPVARENGEE